MLVLPDGTTEEKLTVLIAALEDAIDGANLRTIEPDSLRDLDMRLASVCHALGCERLSQLDPEVANDFGDALLDGEAA